MKVLYIDNFVSERVKVKPVTNAEFDQIKNKLNEKPVLVPLDSIKSVDDLRPGWFVLTNDKRLRVVVPYVKMFFNNTKAKKSKYVFVDMWGFLTSVDYESSFPYIHYTKNNSTFNIIKIFKCEIPDLENICKNKKSFNDWYAKNIRRLFEHDPDRETYRVYQQNYNEFIHTI